MPKLPPESVDTETDMTVYLPQKIGFYTIRKLAYSMCQALTRFGPLIRIYFADRPSLLAVLTAAETVCHDLVTEIDKARADTFPP